MGSAFVLTQTLFLVFKGLLKAKKKGIKNSDYTIIYTNIYVQFEEEGQAWCSQAGNVCSSRGKPHLPDREGFRGGGAIGHRGRIPLNFQRLKCFFFFLWFCAYSVISVRLHKPNKRGVGSSTCDGLSKLTFIPGWAMYLWYFYYCMARIFFLISLTPYDQIISCLLQ